MEQIRPFPPTDFIDQAEEEEAKSRQAGEDG